MPNKYPSVSFVLLSYNQERFIRDAVQSVLSQDHTPLEIILSDDSSTDGTYEIMQAMTNAYRGKHSVRLNRTDTNRGIASHFQQAFRLTTGDLVVYGEGDDISIPERVSTILKEWGKHHYSHSALFSNAVKITPSGQEMGLMHDQNTLFTHTERNGIRICTRPMASGCSIAFSRYVMSSFGPLDGRMMGNDVVLNWRANLLNGICYIAKPLIKYRVHPGGVSNNLMNIRDRDVYLREIEKWSRDRLMRIAQMRRDLDCVSTQSKYALLRGLDRNEQIEKRRLTTLHEDIFRGAAAVFIEMLVARGMRTHLAMPYIARWFPYLTKFR